jgi:glycosyltransferase involved in cell wall biosynthesis
LLWTPLTGVGGYLLQSLKELSQQKPEYQLVGFYNAAGAVPKPPLETGNIQWINYHWSNRLLNAATILGVAPRLDRALGGGGTQNPASVLWLPNINYAQWSSSVPMVLTIHDLAFLRMSEVYNFKWRLWHKLVRSRSLAQRASAIIVPSQATADDMRELLDVKNEKIHVIPHGVQFPDVVGIDGHQSVPNGIHPPYLLYVGTIEPRKNVEAIVEAFTIVHRLHPDLSLVLAGSWGWKTTAVQRAIASSSSRESIRVVNYVDEQLRQALYQNALALVWPSWYEGFGFPVLEAMAAGCPVIAGATSSLFEVAGDAALLVRPYDQVGLVQAIEQVAGDNRLRQVLIERGRERTSQFTWQRTARKMWEVFAGVAR